MTKLLVAFNLLDKLDRFKVFSFDRFARPCAELCRADFVS
jgi:hypothetical protein